jgi:TRAP-type C4-dicarboxylate transport system permease small subunit
MSSPADADAEPEGLISSAPLEFPDDSPLCKQLRKVDNGIGLGEHIALFSLLCIVILVATIQAVANKAFGESFVWSFAIIRDGVFALAMIGAAFATHQQRNLSMDLISRRLRPRARILLRVFLALFVIFIGGLFLIAGWHLTRTVMVETHGDVVPMWVVAGMMPLGALLILVHTLLHMIIDIDYLKRGKLPPERGRVH